MCLCINVKGEDTITSVSMCNCEAGIPGPVCLCVIVKLVYQYQCVYV